MNELKQTAKKGLTGFQIKYLAMIFMVMDHIHYFFEFTGKVPLVFSWLGRLAAPMYLFCLIEGFVHTHDRRKYFLRIYAIAIGMGAMQYIFITHGNGLVRQDGFFPMNQMMASFVVLLVVLQGIDWCKAKQWGKGLCAVIIPIILPYVVYYLMMSIKALAVPLRIMAYTVLPLHSAIMDGGTVTLIVGVALYLTRKNRKVQAAAFCGVILLLDVVMVLAGMKGIQISMFFTDVYEWMEIFAVIFMLAYNGERGRGSKRLFYWFYPAHIYGLYWLSYLLYPWIMAVK